MLGNKITINALTADNGKDLITRALKEIKEEFGYQVSAETELFKGVYYDSQKVGSFIIRAKDKDERKVVLKLQLRPLPADEGLIIRHISQQIKSSRVRLPQIHTDLPWQKKRGYGFVVMEDLSALPHLWQKGYPVTPAEMANHKIFLKEFLNKVLPIKPWFKEPKIDQAKIHQDDFLHFSKIANASSHKHIGAREVLAYKKTFDKIFNSNNSNQLHFTHGHLSGLDIIYDPNQKQYIVLANLLWSFRPQYYELTFPIWVNLMHVNQPNFQFAEFMKIVNQWGDLWQEGLYDHNPLKQKQYWFNLLTRAMYTIMIDLGASEWQPGTEENRQALLDCWQDFFNWLVEHKF